MERLHALTGGLALRAVDTFDPLATALRRELGPASTVETATPDAVRLISRVSDATDPPAADAWSGDAGDAQRVGRIGDRLVSNGPGGWFSVDREEGCTTIRVGPDVRTWTLVRDVVRPLVQVSGHARGVAVAHASAIARGGQGVMVAGWSESGKTEVALALAERGAVFVGDKWTIVVPTAAGASGTPTMGPYPSSVGIRDWVLPFLPRFSAHLGASRKARLAAGTGASAIGRTVSSIGARHRATDAILAPIGQLGSLAATLRLPSSAVRQAYGQPAEVGELPLNVAVLLTTVDAGTKPSIAPVDPAVASSRLARSGAYERRALHLLGERARYHFADGAPVPGFAEAAVEASVLERLLETVPTFEVRTPFPADPGPAADLILSVL